MMRVFPDYSFEKKLEEQNPSQKCWLEWTMGRAVFNSTKQVTVAQCRTPCPTRPAVGEWPKKPYFWCVLLFLWNRCVGSFHSETKGRLLCGPPQTIARDYFTINQSRSPVVSKRVYHYYRFLTKYQTFLFSFLFGALYIHSIPFHRWMSKNRNLIQLSYKNNITLWENICANNNKQFQIREGQ